MRVSRNAMLPPPQPPSKCETSRQGRPSHAGSEEKPRLLMESDIPRIIRGVVPSLTATNHSAPLEAVTQSTSRSRKNKRGRPRIIPSSLRIAPETTLDGTGSKQLKSSQSSAIPLMNASMNLESSSSSLTVPTIPNAVPLINPESSCFPATVPTIPNAVPLINPSSSQQMAM